jgi:hypothetical protein
MSLLVEIYEGGSLRIIPTEMAKLLFTNDHALTAIDVKFESSLSYQVLLRLVE